MKRRIIVSLEPGTPDESSSSGVPAFLRLADLGRFSFIESAWQQTPHYFEPCQKAVDVRLMRKSGFSCPSGGLSERITEKVPPF